MPIFDTISYAYIQSRKKSDDKCKKAICIGYGKSSPAYLTYTPETNKVKRVGCVKFTEFFENPTTSDNYLLPVCPVRILPSLICVPTPILRL